MNRPLVLARHIGLAVVALGLCAAASAQLLNAPAQRITDEAIHADYETYAQQQSSIQALNGTGRHPVRSYSLAKAQCWLDVSFHEYSRNDRSAFVQQALTQSHLITEFLGAGGTVDDPQNPARQTPLVNDAARLREDLWARAAALHGSAGFRCVAQQLACGEVELVHAGNEYNQQQWRHAKPYLQIAEDLLDEAREGASRCEPLPVAVAPTPAPAPKPAPVLEEESLLAQVVFRFDRSGRDDILPASLAQVRELVQRLQDGHHTVVSVRLVGHADRLNGTGDVAYNTRLSERRGLTVRDLLVSLGLSQSLIDTTALGDRGQIEPCAGRFASTSELEACLLPNRRVEILVQATRSLP